MFAWLTSLLYLYLLSNFSCSEGMSWPLYFHWQAIYRKCCWTPFMSSQSTLDVLWSLDGQFPVHAESLFPLFVSLQEGFLRPREFAWLVAEVGWKHWSYCQKEQPSTSKEQNLWRWTLAVSPLGGAMQGMCRTASLRSPSHSYGDTHRHLFGGGKRLSKPLPLYWNGTDK